MFPSERKARQGRGPAREMFKCASMTFDRLEIRGRGPLMQIPPLQRGDHEAGRVLENQLFR
jgi:hypothetical protein